MSCSCTHCTSQPIVTKSHPADERKIQVKFTFWFIFSSCRKNKRMEHGNRPHGVWFLHLVADADKKLCSFNVM